MKNALAPLLLACLPTTVPAADPAQPPAKTSDAPAASVPKELAVAAAVAGAEFNRLQLAKPEFKKAGTVEAALDLLAAAPEPVHRSLQKETLSKHRKEIVALLVMQDGRLSAAPALNEAVALTKRVTVGAKARRNAQNIVSVFSAGCAAGSVELQGAQNLEEAIAFVRTGVMGGGQFAGSVFKCEIEKEELKSALAFITYVKAAGLRYDAEAVLENENDLAPAPPPQDAVEMVGEQLKAMAEMEARRPLKNK